MDVEVVGVLVRDDEDLVSGHLPVLEVAAHGLHAVRLRGDVRVLPRQAAVLVGASHRPAAGGYAGGGLQHRGELAGPVHVPERVVDVVGPDDVLCRDPRDAIGVSLVASVPLPQAAGRPLAEQQVVRQAAGPEPKACAVTARTSRASRRAWATLAATRSRTLRTSRTNSVSSYSKNTGGTLLRSALATPCSAARSASSGPARAASRRCRLVGRGADVDAVGRGDGVRGNPPSISCITHPRTTAVGTSWRGANGLPFCSASAAAPAMRLSSLLQNASARRMLSWWSRRSAGSMRGRPRFLGTSVRSPVALTQPST